MGGSHRWERTLKVNRPFQQNARQINMKTRLFLSQTLDKQSAETKNYREMTRGLRRNCFSNARSRGYKLTGRLFHDRKQSATDMNHQCA